MFRWNVFGTRLLIVTLTLAVLWIGARSLAPILVRQTIARTFGDAVEFENCLVDWSKASAEIGELQIAHPNDPLRNLVHARLVSLKFNTESLAKRQLVIERIDAKGVMLGTPRDRIVGDRMNGSAIPTASSPAPIVEHDLTAAAKTWLDRIQSRPPMFRDTIGEFGALIESIGNNWQSEFDRRKKLAEEIRQGIDAIAAELTQPGQNPLRTGDRRNELLSEWERLKIQLDEGRTWLASWESNQAADFRRLHEAAALAMNVNLGNDFGGDIRAASEELLISQSNVDSVRQVLACGEELQRRLNELAEFSRRTVPRGRNWVFRGQTPTPSVLIRELAFQGSIHLNAEHVEFAGGCSNLVDRPEWAGQPTRFWLKGQGIRPFAIDGTWERNNGIPTQRMHFQLPPADSPEQEIGSASALIINLSPHRAQTEAEIEIIGDQVDGVVTCYHSSLGLYVNFLNDLAGGAAVQSKLNQRLSTIQNLEIKASISGTLAKPQVKFTSGLAQTFAAAMTESVNEHLAEVAASNKIEIEKRLVEAKTRLGAFAKPELQNLDGIYSASIRRIADLGKTVPATDLRNIR